MNPRLVAEKGTNASPSTALEGGCATRTAMDGFTQLKERAAELVAAAEGDAQAGASTAEQMHMLLGARVLHLEASHMSLR